jgi:pimeloyl-ACP methyl ester carboxylesterase
VSVRPGNGTQRGRWPSLDCRQNFFKAGFIEFDDDGNAMDPAQLQKVQRLIEFEKKRAPEGKVITLLYVHGWRNNAKNVDPGDEPKDVEKFEAALSELGYRSRDAAPDTPVPVVGVYMGWRGRSLNGPGWFTFIDFWPRRNAANRVGGGRDFAGAVNDVINTTNGPSSSDGSRVLLVGHSFGARVLENAIETDRVKLYEESKGTDSVRPRVDLVLYVNSANDSRLSLRRVDILKKANFKVRRSDYDEKECAAKPAGPTCGDYPLLVAITSRGDQATKRVLPVANRVNQDKAIAPLPAITGVDYLDDIPAPGRFGRTAAAHFPFMQSHEVDEIGCPDTGEPVCAAGDKKCFAFRGRGECPACYKVTARASTNAGGRTLTPFNETPFWIMDVDTRVVKDHGDIWNLNFVSMLGALVAPRGFFEPKTGRMTLRTK